MTLATKWPALHPLASLFPVMSDREYTELRDDISARGQLVPVTLYQGRVIDGRHRLKACRELDVAPLCQSRDDLADVTAFVIAVNLKRRHLNESQRAMVAEKLATLGEGRPRANSANLQSISVAKAGDMMQVSPRSVQTARAVREADPDLAARVEAGEMRLNEAARVLNRAEKVEAVRVATMPALGAMTQRYAVLYADPPWQYEPGSVDDSRVIENQYPTMTLDAIKALPVGEIAHMDAVLFCWATSPKLEEALSVLGAWGFRYRTCAVWVKPQIGMGYYFRQQHELLLVATRGALPVPLEATRPGSVLTHDRLRHSEKPTAFRSLIERMYPDVPRIELFARELTPGWDVWGSEV